MRIGSIRAAHPTRSRRGVAPQMAKFRKKPVVIEAIQWRGSADDLLLSDFVPHNLWCRNSDGQPCIKTLESGKGFHIVSEGDWVIRGVKGEFYPCKPDIFAQTYEPAEAAGHLGIK